MIHTRNIYKDGQTDRQTDKQTDKQTRTCGQVLKF